MGILLAVLKILGIILLVILGLILLILLLVLFVPICYRIKAVHNDNETTADVKVSYLVLNAKGHFDKDNGLSYWAKILFFKIYPKKEKIPKAGEPDEDFLEGDIMDGNFPDEEPEEDISENLVTEETSVQETPDQEYSVQETIEEDSSVNDDIEDDNLEDGFSEYDDLEEPDFASDIDSGSKKSILDKIKNRKSDKKNKQGREKKKRVKKSFGQMMDDISEKTDEVLDKVEEGMDKLDEKYVNAVKKIDHVEQFLDRDYVQRTIARALKVIKRLLLTIKPKKSRGYLKMGLGSAADTGNILGKISMFYALYGSWLEIEPDFYNKVIEADIDFRGRIYLFRFILPALRILISPDFWKTKKLAEKI
ncbi:MAG: DUF2953 domain-containing protein [Eubacterium sp.]|nr:DUF2953 domain-containing protein [Eubacterium sp.]